MCIVVFPVPVLVPASASAAAAVASHRASVVHRQEALELAQAEIARAHGVIKQREQQLEQLSHAKNALAAQLAEAAQREAAGEELRLALSEETERLRRDLAEVARANIELEQQALSAQAAVQAALEEAEALREARDRMAAEVEAGRVSAREVLALQAGLAQDINLYQATAQAAVDGRDAETQTRKRMEADLER